ncbi:hypothetical protein Tco_0533661 [Tanacetum coccineum]
MSLSLAENVIIAGVDNRFPMLDKTQYSSWASRMLLYIRGKENGKLLVDSVLNEPFKYGIVIVPGTQTTPATVRERTYDELTDAEKIREGIMSTPDYIYPIIVPSDSNVEDAFSSTNTPDYTPASPDYYYTPALPNYSPASPGNTFSDPSEDVMQAYNAASNESPIPPPRAPIAPLSALPPSLVLPLSPIFDPRDFFLP